MPAIKKARDAGVLVIALDTPTEPQSAVDALFATDNLKAGELIGEYAKAKAEKMGITPKIAMLDLAPGISVGVLRHDGFLKGFGIKEGDPQIVGAAHTLGDTAKGQTAMETAAPEGPGHQRHLLDQRAVGLRRRERAEGGRQGPEGLHPRLRRRRLRRDQARHQDRRDRRDVAAVPAEDGRAGRREGRGVGARRQEAVRLHRHRREAHHRGPGRRASSPRTPPTARRTAGASAIGGRPGLRAGRRSPCPDREDQS